MISIIVPVYNAEKYIARCIESVINQTYTDWELVLIDDGSKDKGGFICDEYARKDKRIHVIHSFNEGVSAARNKGLELAKGEWITFIDSDDWIEDNHLQCFVDQFRPDIDLCINSFVTDLRMRVKPFVFPDLSTTDNLQSIEVLFTQLRVHFQFLWNKIFRRSYIENNSIRFDTKLSLGEDNVFILEYSSYIRGISSTSTCTYHYDQADENPLSLGRRKRPNSELCYQLTANCNAVLKLYETCGLEVLVEHASDYYYTRIFQKIILPNVQYCFGLAKLPANPFEYFKCSRPLDSSKIVDKAIRRFWISMEKKKSFIAWIVLNIYIMRLWLKSKIIKNVVAVRHAFKSVRSIASH